MPQSRARAQLVKMDPLASTQMLRQATAVALQLMTVNAFVRLDGIRRGRVRGDVTRVSMVFFHFQAHGLGLIGTAYTPMKPPATMLER